MLNRQESINNIAHLLARRKANMYLSGENDLRLPVRDYALTLAIVFQEQCEPIEQELLRYVECRWLEVLEDVEAGH